MASTYTDQIADAANWADRHSHFNGADLAKTISDDNLPWGASVQALLPFASVLDLMRDDMDWSHSLGDAVLADQDEVMNAVQRARQAPRNNGYLKTNEHVKVISSDDQTIEIEPADPGVIYVPVYDPNVVLAQIDSAITAGAIVFATAIVIADYFEYWRWREHCFDWRAYRLWLDGQEWHRGWRQDPDHDHQARDHDNDHERPVPGHEHDRDHLGCK